MIWHLSTFPISQTKEKLSANHYKTNEGVVDVVNYMTLLLFGTISSFKVRDYKFYYRYPFSFSAFFCKYFILKLLKYHSLRTNEFITNNFSIHTFLNVPFRLCNQLELKLFNFLPKFAVNVILYKCPRMTTTKLFLLVI